MHEPEHEAQIWVAGTADPGVLVQGQDFLADLLATHADLLAYGCREILEGRAVQLRQIVHNFGTYHGLGWVRA